MYKFMINTSFVFLTSLATVSSAVCADKLMIPIAPPQEKLPVSENLVTWPVASFAEFEKDSVGNLSSWFHDAPAGKHGRVLINKDGTMSFENGKPARFWGTTTTYGATFPADEKDIVKLADGIAARGYNLVRFHHNDMAAFGLGYLSVDPKSNYALNPKGVDRLDRFAAELIKRGIYLYVDLIDYRPVLKNEEIYKAFPDMKGNNEGWKGVFPHESAVAAWKKAAKALLDHKNPYTGNRWADEPAVVMVEIINENGPFWDWSFKVPKSTIKWYDTAWNEWLLKKYKTRDNLAKAWTNEEGVCGLFSDEDPAKKSVFRPRLTRKQSWKKPQKSRTRGVPRMNDYYEHLHDLSVNFYAEAKSYLRELGYKGPVMGSHELNGPSNRKAESTTGVVGAHLYATGDLAWKARPSSKGVSINGVDVMSHNWFSNIFRVKVADKTGGKVGVNGEWTGKGVTKHADVNVGVAAISAFQKLPQTAHFGYGSRWRREKTPNYDDLYQWAGYLGRIKFAFSYTNHIPWMMVNRVCAPMLVRGDMKPSNYKVHIAFSTEDTFEQTEHSLGGVGGGGTVGRAANFLSIMHNSESYFFDKVYDGDADVVFTSGRTSSGDYSKAKRAVIIGDNPWVDRYHKKRDIGFAARKVRPEVKIVKLDGLTEFEVAQPWKTKKILKVSKLEGAVEVSSIPSGATPIGISEDGKYTFGWIDEKYMVLPNAGAFEKHINDNQWLYRLYISACKKWNMNIGNNDADKHTISSDNGEFAVDWGYGTTVINSDKTQGFSGVVGWRPKNKAKNLEVSLENPYGNVLVTSAGNKSLKDSEKMLLIATGMMKNTGQKIGPNKSGALTVTKIGKGPVLVEGLTGQIKLANVNASELNVYAMDHKGRRALKIPTEVVDGVLVFNISPLCKTVWFEVTKEVDESVAVLNDSKSVKGEFEKPELIALKKFYDKTNVAGDVEEADEESASEYSKIWIRKFNRAGVPVNYGNIKAEIGPYGGGSAALKVIFGKQNPKDWHAGWFINVKKSNVPDVKALGMSFKGDGTMPRDFFIYVQCNGFRYKTKKNMKSIFENDDWQQVVVKPSDFIIDPSKRKKYKGKQVPATPNLSALERIDCTAVGPLMSQKHVGIFRGFYLCVEKKEQKNPIRVEIPKPAAPESKNISVKYVSGVTIKADGIIDEKVWKHAAALAMDEDNVPDWHFFGSHVVVGDRNKGEGADFYMLATDEGLALIADVNKGGKPVVAQVGQWWMNDCVEVFTDVNNTEGKPTKQLFLAYKQSVSDLPKASDDSIKIGRAKTKKGYLLEVVMPWKSLGFEDKPTSEFGLDFQVDFAAKGRNRVLQMGYGTAVNEAWISGKNYLKVTLK